MNGDNIMPCFVNSCQFNIQPRSIGIQWSIFYSSKIPLNAIINCRFLCEAERRKWANLHVSMCTK